MVKCVQIRYILEDEKAYHNIHSNGRFLTISEFDDTMAHNDRCVAVYDVEELVDTKVASRNLWKKNFDYLPRGDFEQINAVSNTTSILVSHSSKISVLNFWKDRIIPSREFLQADIIHNEEDENEDDDSDWMTTDDSGQDEEEEIEEVQISV